MRKIKINGIYKHFKGDYYLVIDVANHSETKEKDDLRESNIITENEYNKIYDLHIRKESKESYKKDKFFTNILCILVT